MQQLQIEGTVLELLPEKAIYINTTKTIIVTDLHWGKTGHFRKNGIAIPLGTQHADERRLSELVRKYNTERLVIAGDFFHSRANNETDNFSHWRDAHKQLHIALVTGNHDILPNEQYADWNITVHDPILDEGDFLISHDDIPKSDKFYLHGHIHPSCKISGNGRMGITLPCYCMDNYKMAMPAFGSFTGSKRIDPKDYNSIYIIAEDEVIQWK